MPYDKTFVTQSGMKSHGWTAAAIRDILGKPDMQTDNPHGGQYPMRLFRTSRVLAAEQSSQFAEHLAKQGLRHATNPQEIANHFMDFISAYRRFREQQ